MAGLHGRRRRVKAAAPNLHLLLAVLGRRLGLVQTGQTAVVAFVQAPRLVDRDALLARLLQDRGQRHLGARQQRRVRHIELEPRILDRFARGQRLVNAYRSGSERNNHIIQNTLRIHGAAPRPLTLGAQIRIEPAAEQILFVPLGLAVAHHHNLVFAGHLSTIVLEMI